MNTRGWVRQTAPALGAAVAVALAARLVFALGYWVDKPLTHDEYEYLHLAESLVAGRGFSYAAAPAGQPEPERFGRAPVYPLYLAAIARIAPAGRELSAIRVAQSLTGTLAVLLLGLIAAQVCGRRAGVGAAWIAALYPPLIWMPAYVLSETLYTALALANVLMLQSALPVNGTDSGRLSRLAVSGVLGGLAALTRPAHLFFLLLVGLWLMARGCRSAVAVVAVGALLTIAPWTARNLREYGRFVLIASEGGITFWTGNHPLAVGEGDLAANPAIKLDNRRLRAEHPGLTPEQLEPVYYREAFRGIAADPLRWLKLLARKMFYLWVPVGPSYTLHSSRYLAASLVSYGVLLPLAIAGARASYRAKRWPQMPGLLLASAVLVCMVFFPQERFRIPAIDPVLIVLAACRRPEAAVRNA